jgi:hypothetical protein
MAERSVVVDTPMGGEAFDLQRTWLAVGAAWLFPGAGHAILGRVRRGVFFAVIVWGSFALGLSHDGRLALYDADGQWLLSSFQIVANVGIGPADLVARLFVYGRPAYFMPSRVNGRASEEATQIFRERTRSGLSVYGTAYLWTAGLMNLLLLFDVWDIGRGRKPSHA